MKQLFPLLIEGPYIIGMKSEFEGMEVLQESCDSPRKINTNEGDVLYIGYYVVEYDDRSPICGLVEIVH